jgi:hypothetical protein
LLKVDSGNFSLNEGKEINAWATVPGNVSYAREAAGRRAHRDRLLKTLC